MKIWNKNAEADTVTTIDTEALALAKTKRQAFLWRNAKRVTVGTFALIGVGATFAIARCTGNKDNSNNAESVES